MKVFLLSQYACDTAKQTLSELGAVIELRANPILPRPKQCHADMQVAKINQSTAIFAPGTDEAAMEALSAYGISVQKGASCLSGKYPGNIAYNILKVGRMYFHNTHYTDGLIRTLAARSNAASVFVHVKQGYAGCSSVAVGTDWLVTSDRGILRAAQAHGISCRYYIGTDRILLRGYDHGLIGGCSGYDPDLGFLLHGTADRNLHSCLPPGTALRELTAQPPEDIGGIAVFETAEPCTFRGHIMG